MSTIFKGKAYDDDDDDDLDDDEHGRGRPDATI